MTPIPSDLARAENAPLLAVALDDIHQAIPQASIVGFFFEEARTDSTDWLALLDVVHAKGFRAVVGFLDFLPGGGHEGFRPERVGDEWAFGNLGTFVACEPCTTHPALYAVATLDEPWHHEKRPFYSTDDLKSVYVALKALAPPGVDVPFLMGFSRLIWKRIVQNPALGVYWDGGMTDVALISGLELQNRTYQFDQLDGNHTYSRRVIDGTTPDLPLWTTVQAFGSGYGPGPGYWFPRERGGDHDLTRLLDDLTAERYAAEHPLTGIWFQNWDSVQAANRPGQFTLGDAYLSGQPAEQAQASEEALRAIQSWFGPATGAAPAIEPEARVRLQVVPSPAVGWTSLVVGGSRSGIGAIWVVDLLGRVVRRVDGIALSAGHSTVGVDLAGLVPGTYVAVVERAEGRAATPFVVGGH